MKKPTRPHHEGEVQVADGVGGAQTRQAEFRQARGPVRHKLPAPAKKYWHVRGTFEVDDVIVFSSCRQCTPKVRKRTTDQ